MQQWRWFLHLLIRSITIQRWRTMLILLSLVIAVLLVTTMGQLAFGIRKELGTQLSVYGANLLVLPAGTQLDLHFGQYRFGAVTVQSYFPEARLLSFCARERASAITYIAMLKGIGYLGQTPAHLLGLNRQAIRTQSGFSRFQGRWPQADHEVILGCELARQLELQVNQPCVIKIGEQPMTLLPTAILQTGGEEDQAIIIEKSLLERLLACPGQISEAALVVPVSRRELEQLAARLELLAPEVKTQVVRQVAFATENLLNKVILLLSLVTAVVICATSISMMSTLGVIVLERRQEFGVMEALGASRAQVCRMLLAESLLLGTIAALLGLPLGIWLSGLFSQQIFDVSLRLYPQVIGIGLIGGWLIAVLGSLVPIRKVLRWNTVAMLRE